MKEKLLSHRHHITFAVFLIIHALTCLFTTYFGDDYYYAAFVRNGAEYMVSENIFHYMNTNGRALVHLIDELLLGFSFCLWQITAVAVMAAIAIVCAKLAARTYRKDTDPERYKNALIAVCALISVTDIAILRQSVYWATGSLNYLYPAALTLWFVYLLRLDFEQPHTRMTIALPILAFFTSATTEQASAASLLAVLWILVSGILRHKRVRIAWIVSLVTSLSGFLTLMLSPGSAARTQYYPDFYELSIFERIKTNFRPLSAVVFGPDGMYALIVAVFAIVAYRAWKRLPILSVLSTLAAVLYVIALRVDHRLLGEWWFLLLFASPLLTVMIVTLIDYFRSGETDNLYFVWCSVAMQCAMAISPEYGPRTLTMSVFLLLIPIARAIIEISSPKLNAMLALSASALIFTDHFPPSLLTLLLVIGTALCLTICARPRAKIASVALMLTLVQFATVPAGYAENLEAHAANRRQIEAYDPTSGEPLTLYYLPNPTYKYTMPYDDPYHQYVLMLLCQFPADTEVVYAVLDERGT